MASMLLVSLDGIGDELTIRGCHWEGAFDRALYRGWNRVLRHVVDFEKPMGSGTRWHQRLRYLHQLQPTGHHCCRQFPLTQVPTGRGDGRGSLAGRGLHDDRGRHGNCTHPMHEYETRQNAAQYRIDTRMSHICTGRSQSADHGLGTGIAHPLAFRGQPVDSSLGQNREFHKLCTHSTVGIGHAMGILENTLTRALARLLGTAISLPA